MGRKAGRVKNSKMFRIGIEEDNQIEEILKYWRASRGFHNTKTYTRSLVVEQAISEYYKIQRANHETNFKYCGACGNPKNDARASD
tara:strand:+ start:226 stop:483 length:258 start_codon:yes stop_codon:yes gene_type:complete